MSVPAMSAALKIRLIIFRIKVREWRGSFSDDSEIAMNKVIQKLLRFPFNTSNLHNPLTRFVVDTDDIIYRKIYLIFIYGNGHFTK